jgi:hypothetical protein
VDYFGGRGAFGLLARLARVTPGLCHHVPLILHLTCRPAGAAQRAEVERPGPKGSCPAIAPTTST